MVQSLVVFLTLLLCAEAVTPVQKVVELLQGLEKKVIQEGKEEAAAYDRYSCFCKEQADNKLYAIETSTAKIAELDAKIGKLGTEISELDGDIGALSTTISNLTTTMQTKAGDRDGEHAIFVASLADTDGAIDAVERAIQAMKESKKALAGKAELEASLAQVRAVAKLALAVGSDLTSLGEPGDAYTYKYHANDIIATLQRLLMTFKNRKAQLEEDEFRTHTAFELNQQALSNEKKFAEKEKREKEQVREAKAEEKEATEADRTQEDKDMSADKNFMRVVKGDCEGKATLWDQRSTTRAAELTALNEAMEALRTGVAPNWKANKKLVGLEKKVMTHRVYVEDGPKSVASRPASFLQLRGALRGASKGATGGTELEGKVAEKLQHLLQSSAQSLGSPVLSTLALKVSMSEDHFVKVRQIIKDLISRLDSEANAEASTKSFCDTEMASATSKRDSEKALVEDLSAQISGKEAELGQLEREIAELSDEIAKNKKTLAEATQLRQEERAENERTVTDAGVGKAEVEHALNVLRQFYGALLQTRFVPTDSDREGLTVADRAPQVFDAEYQGSQEASKGIIGMLEVILADFDRTGVTVAGDESDAQGNFQNLESANKLDTQTKETAVDTKKGQITDIEGELLTLRDGKAEAMKGHKLANAELTKLRSMCVAGEETYEERVAKRVKEIEALKQAHDILESWQR